MALNESAPVPLSEAVTVTEEPDVPATWLPKLILAGTSERLACVANPDSGIICGLPGALSATLRLAVRDALEFTFGLNIILITQAAPAPRTGGQLLVLRKSAAFVPDMLMLFIESDDVPVFATETDCAVLAIPTLCDEKFSPAGET